MTTSRLALPTLLLTVTLAACGAPQALPTSRDTSGVLSAPVDRSFALSVGQSRQLPLAVDGSRASPADVAWSSSDPDVVTVDLGGTVTAVGAGEATVKATLRSNQAVALGFTLTVSAPVGAGGSFERRVFELVNQARAQGRACGDRTFSAAAPVTWNSALGTASEAYSRDMATRGFFGHISPDGRGLADRLHAAGVGGLTLEAENIAGGQPTPEAVMRNWLLSPTHCATIMNPAFQELGVGYVRGGAYQHYWTEIFARR